MKAVLLLLLEHMTNEYVWCKVESLVGPMEPLRAIGKWWKLIWFGHVTLHYNLCKLSSREGTFDCVRRWGRQHKNWTEDTIEWTNMTLPGRLGEGWVESLTWRRNSVSSVRGVMMVMVMVMMMMMVMVMMVHVYVSLFRIIFRPLASNPWCTSSSRSSSFMPRWLFWGNHCNACGMFYHWWKCAENQVDLADEVTVAFHWMVYHSKINLVTKTIMKNNLFKIKCVKWFA